MEEEKLRNWEKGLSKGLVNLDLLLLARISLCQVGERDRILSMHGEARANRFSITLSFPSLSFGLVVLARKRRERDYKKD